MLLTDYRGEVSGRVKVGTIKRPKGLEFKQVVLARVPGRLLGGAADVGEFEDGARERSEIERRELYVGTTRAREGLTVWKICRGSVPHWRLCSAGLLSAGGEG